MSAPETVVPAPPSGESEQVRPEFEPHRVYENELLVTGHGDVRQYVRVVKVVGHLSTRVVAVFDCGQRPTWPRWVSLDEVEDGLKHGIYRRATKDVFVDALPRVHLLRESELQIGAQRWRWIEPLVSDNRLRVFDPATRVAAIAEAAAAAVWDDGKHGVTPKVLRDVLRLFWRNGQHPHALAGAFRNCGAPGVRREPGVAKRGRRATSGVAGINISAALAAFMISVARELREVPAPQRPTWEDVHDELLDRIARVRAKSAAGDAAARAHGLPDEGDPSMWQLMDRYNADRAARRVEVAQRSTSERDYANNVRQLTASASALATGPGAIAQIDSTQVGVYLVARDNRRQVIGRPTLYVVTDVWSRYVIGIHVTLAAPSAIGARRALAIAMTDKVPYAARFGVDITPADWFARHRTAQLVIDRGELMDEDFERAILAFQMENAVCAPYAAPWKPHVESKFRLFDRRLVRWLPGSVDPALTRGDPDYRRFARMTLPAFAQAMIVTLLEFNNNRPIRDDLPSDYPVAELGYPTPAVLWRFGEATRGRPGTLAREFVESTLLPSTTASATEHGLHCNGVRYRSAYTLARGDHLRERPREAVHYHVIQDDADVSQIILTDARGQEIERAQLHDADAQFRGWSYDEIEDYRARIARADAAHDAPRREGRLDTRLTVEAILAREDAATQAALADGPLLLSGMREANVLDRRHDADAPASTETGSSWTAPGIVDPPMSARPAPRLAGSARSYIAPPRRAAAGGTGSSSDAIGAEGLVVPVHTIPEDDPPQRLEAPAAGEERR